MEINNATLLPLFLIAIIFFNRYFFGLFLKKIAHANEDPLFGQEPAVTVIIPLYNEGPSIYSTLLSLAQTDYPKDKLKIMVVDDCSSDDSYSWAMKAAGEYSFIEVYRNPTNVGKRIGISRAVQRTTTDFVVSVDSDVIVCPDAIRKLISGFTSNEIAAVGGRVHVLNCNVNWLTKMQTIKYFMGYQFLKNLENSFLSVLCLSGCLTAYRRHVLIELEPILMDRNLFSIPIKYGEDRFLTRQILKYGYKTKLIEDAACYTKAPHTLEGYFSQQLRWRRSNIVDFIGGLTHIWKLNWLVSTHYYAMQCIVIAYPVYLWGVFLSGGFFEAATLHSGILGLYALVYAFHSREMEEKYRVHPLYTLLLGIMLPLTYMVLSILALLTLDSGSWETRGGKKKKAATP